MGFADFSGRNINPNIYRWDDIPCLEIIAHYFQFPSESVITYKCSQNHKHVCLANYCSNKILPSGSPKLFGARVSIYLTI